MLPVYVINTRESNLIERYKRRPFSVGQNMTRQRRALQATVGSHIELQKPVPYSGSNPDALSVVTLSLWLGPVLLSTGIIASNTSGTGSHDHLQMLPSGSHGEEPVLSLQEEQ